MKSRRRNEKLAAAFSAAACFFTCVAAILLLAWLDHPARAGRAAQSLTTAPTPQNAEEAKRLNNLGTAYMARQNFELALKQFQQAAALDPQLAAAQLNEGIALFNMQKFDDARAALEKFARENPESARASYNLGLLYRNQGDAKSALDAFERVVKLEPRDADTWYFLGMAHDDLHDESAALEAFTKALELNPLHASAEFGSARAYQRLGDAAKAKQHFDRFQELTQRKLAAPLSLTYGDQGALSLAEQSGNSLAVAPPEIPVKFVDKTARAGLPHERYPTMPDRIGNALHGACWFDFDGDGKPDLLLASSGKSEGARLFRNLGNGKFQDATAAAGFASVKEAESCAAGDFDNDGKTDIAFGFGDHVALYRNLGGGIFQNVTQRAGLTASGYGAESLLWVDFDHDGDLDIFSTGFSGASRMWRNNNNGTFADVTSELSLVFDGAKSSAFTDYNNDRAIDLVLTGAKTRALTNPREGKWSASEPWSRVVPATNAVAIADFDKDGWMDFVFTHSAAPAISAWKNMSGRAFEPFAGEPRADDLVEARGVVAFDYDNDGWIDLAVVGRTRDGKGAVRLFRNLGKGGFKDVTHDVGLDAIALFDPQGIYAADYKGDGASDLLITESDGSVKLLRIIGGNKNHFLRISLAGLNDNKSAVGTKVEVFAGASSQKFEIGNGGSLGQSATDLLVGLGKETKADVVRLLWPTGVPQDEIAIVADKTAKIAEIDRRGSSCPILFAWNGSRYEFVSDILGAGVLGHWVGPGQRNIPRPLEYLKLESVTPRERDGKLSFRFMEPLEEAVYLDQVRLLAIDHPGNFDVYPNEYFASNPPYPEYRVIASRDARPPAGAWDDRGKDVLSLLARRDHRYVLGFELLSFKGFTKPHTLELDLGEAYRGGPLRLIMHGYIEYFTATSMFAAYQAGIEPFAPYIEALDARGKWIRVIDDVGFPAGLPRATVADLTGKLPKGTRRIRLTTNLQIYWDQILIDRTANLTAGQIRSSEVPLASAQLDFHGFPRAIERKSPGDINYIYEQASATGPFTRPAGAYTRTGDVYDLLTHADDRMVVFGSGDEVQLEFDASHLPSIPIGWKRDYFFFADGYEKDMDFYAAHGLSVAPLPFGAMPEYPYSESDLRRANPRWNWDELLNLNTRMFSGDEVASYRYHYGGRDARADAKTANAAAKSEQR